MTENKDQVIFDHRLYGKSINKESLLKGIEKERKELKERLLDCSSMLMSMRIEQRLKELDELEKSVKSKGSEL